MASNPYTNKVVYGGNTLIDLSGDTLVSADQLLKGIVAHCNDGSSITGTLEAGGGGGVDGIPAPFSKFATGTFLLSSLKYANAYPITHGLGVAPKLFLIFTGEPGSYSSGAINHICYIDDANTNVNKLVGYANSKNSTYGWNNRSSALVDENTFTFNSSTDYFSSNRLYRWVAIV